MSKPSFVSLRANYPDKIDMPPEKLYEEIGRPDLSNDPNWKNTCAVRVSLALVKSGMKIDTGHMTIMTGKHKGSKIEQNQLRLSRYLSRRSVLGEPEKFMGGGAAAKGIAPVGESSRFSSSTGMQTRRAISIWSSPALADIKHAHRAASGHRLRSGFGR